VDYNINFLLNLYRNFEWTREHEKILVREILVQEPFAHPKGSLARGKIWGNIADMLNDLKYPIFRVQKRSVREKFNSPTKVQIQNEKGKGCKYQFWRKMKRRKSLGKKREKQMIYD